MSVFDLMKEISSNRNVRASEGQLDNPDIPDIMDDQVEIKDKAFSALRLQSEPRNGNYFRLPRTTFTDNPREDAFLQNNAIDPNIIRKRVDPDSAIPTLQDAASTLFSLVPDNLAAYDSNDLITKAHMMYLNYKNRHGGPEHRNEEPIVTAAHSAPPTGNSPVENSPDTLPEGIIQKPVGPDDVVLAPPRPPLYNGDIPGGGIPTYQKPPLTGVRPSVRKPISSGVPTLGHI